MDAGGVAAGDAGVETLKKVEADLDAAPDLRDGIDKVRRKLP